MSDVLAPALPKATHHVVGGPTDPSHDERLRRGIIDTDVRRPLAWCFSVLFLASIYGVPIGQAVLEKRADEDSSLSPLFERSPTGEHLHQFEHDLEQASYAKAYVQPRVQEWLSRYGRAGNTKGVIGRGGFLYYTPGLTHLAGPSFLDRDALDLRTQEALDDDARIHPDPRPAIFAFAEMLARRGITLVLFPAPDKASLQPLQLHGRGDARRPLPVARNVGFARFAAELHAHHVLLFDPAPTTIQPGEAPRFLVQDTHWTPTWMEAVARKLATFVSRTVSLPPVPRPALRAVAMQARRVGDLVDMLKLPEDQSTFRPQAVTVHQVQDADGAPWEPDPSGDVLLLGDSFTNVFSMDFMGWGESAGLGPQLALALGRPVDVIAENNEGAFATRQALFRALDGGEDRLAGKRVVIWEFAARELSVGDWKAFDWTRVAHVGARP